MLLLLLYVLTALSLLAMLTLIGLFLYGYYHNRTVQPSKYTPKVCVIVPCKTKEYNLEENLTAICSQQYPSYSVLFVVDSDRDAAYPTVTQVALQQLHARIVYTKKLEGCSGKISALITGVHNAGDADVFVFADSDITPHRDWLQYLVSFLADDTMGATTGFRWYFPTNKKSWLIATWNLAALSALFHPMSNYAWGGSTGIRASLFHELDIESQWKQGFSDDLILTETVKNAGYAIRFLPHCVSESPSNVTIKQFLRWGSQQLTWVRWYNPLLWVLSFVGILFVNVFSVLGFFFLLTRQYLVGGLMVSLFALQMVYGLVGILTMRRYMRYPPTRFRGTAGYLLLMPVAFFLYGYNILVSSVKKQIVWAGRTYRKKDVIR
ncbi:MAG: glycosyltransferase family 2 protein [Candidatus Thermoplasmatota archaeon]|nr:glycosyltransferase family 2 protein [Candidatus Thermoplasmatota archaeon]